MTASQNSVFRISSDIAIFVWSKFRSIFAHLCVISDSENSYNWKGSTYGLRRREKIVLRKGHPTDEQSISNLCQTVTWSRWRLAAKTSTAMVLFVTFLFAMKRGFPRWHHHTSWSLPLGNVDEPWWTMFSQTFSTSNSTDSHVSCAPWRVDTNQGPLVAKDSGP